MHFLVLAILSSFCIGILIKLNESRGVNTLVVLAGNYLSAFALGWAYVFGYGVGTGLPAAFVLISPLRRGDMQRVDRRALWFFPLLVLLLGTSEFWVNLFNKVGVAEEKFVFMTLIFSFSCVPAWAAVLAKKQRVEKSAFLRGMLLGIPNFFSMFFFLESLKSPVFLNLSMVVYTVYSVSVMALAFGAGALFWKERVTRANVIGIMFAIAAIILLNL